MKDNSFKCKSKSKISNYLFTFLFLFIIGLRFMPKLTIWMRSSNKERKTSLKSNQLCRILTWLQKISLWKHKPKVKKLRD